MSTAEQDGTSTVHQTITCHYHVYAPTTVHVKSSVPTCVTESSSESATEGMPRTSIAQGPIEADAASLKEVKLEIDEALLSMNPEGKRETIPRWLIIKLTLLLQKVSRQDKCVATIG